MSPLTPDCCYQHAARVLLVRQTFLIVKIVLQIDVEGLAKLSSQVVRLRM